MLVTMLQSPQNQFVAWYYPKRHDTLGIPPSIWLVRTIPFSDLSFYIRVVHRRLYLVID
jgi:hypothetical protein